MILTKDELAQYRSGVISRIGTPSFGMLLNLLDTIDALESSLAGRKKAAENKPCYILGMETIRKVASEGALQTEQVAFVAADDLYHQKVYTEDRRSALAEVVRQAKLEERTLCIAAQRDIKRALMKSMHDDLENCLKEGKDPVLLLVVWRCAIAAAGAHRSQVAEH